MALNILNLYRTLILVVTLSPAGSYGEVATTQESVAPAEHILNRPPAREDYFTACTNRDNGEPRSLDPCENLQLQRQFYLELGRSYLSDVVRQSEAAKQIIQCIDNPSSGECIQTLLWIDITLPQQAREARGFLAGALDTVQQQAFLSSDLSRPNRSLRSPALKEVESWEPLSQKELQAAQAKLQKKVDYIQPRVREQNGVKRINDWRLLRDSMDAERGKSLEKYYSLIDTTPFLLHTKNSHPSRYDIREAALKIMRNANQLGLRIQSLLKPVTNFPSRCTSTSVASPQPLSRAPSPQQARERWSYADSAQTEFLISQPAQIEKLLAGQPQFCQIANRLVGSAETKSYFSAARQIGALQAAAMVNPYLGGALGLALTAAALVTSRNHIRQLQDQMAAKVHGDFGVTPIDIEEEKANLGADTLINAAGYIPINRIFSTTRAIKK